MLKTKDMFLLSAIADKTGIAEQLPTIMKDKDANTVGVKIVGLVISKLYKAENEVIALIVSSTGKSLEQVKGMALKELIETVKGILAEEGVLDFFTNSAEE